MRETILIRGARENNLKNITVEIPRDKLIVLTGLSGSGKSSASRLTRSMRRRSGALWSLSRRGRGGLCSSRAVPKSMRFSGSRR